MRGLNSPDLLGVISLHLIIREQGFKEEAQMSKYVFPAVFTAEEGGLYAVNFPDLESCYTSGEDLADALKMAEDVLALTLYEYEKQKKPIPKPSDPQAISVEKNEFINYVAADTLYYQKKFNRKSVKKTLTIPEWLNDLAVAQNINFSQTLQEAVENKLGISF